MRRQSLIWLGILVVGFALPWGPSARGQSAVQPVKVEVTVPAVPNIGTIVPGPAPSELAVSARGVVYLGYRGAYHVVGGTHQGHAMFRDANNRFWATNLTYYGMSNGYWIASVNGLPDTYMAFQATPMSSDAPYFKVLIHTPNVTGYTYWDEATRGNSQ
jgi:hypothetical protein